MNVASRQPNSTKYKPGILAYSLINSSQRRLCGVFLGPGRLPSARLVSPCTVKAGLPNRRLEHANPDTNEDVCHYDPVVPDLQNYDDNYPIGDGDGTSVNCGLVLRVLNTG